MKGIDCLNKLPYDVQVRFLKNLASSQSTDRQSSIAQYLSQPIGMATFIGGGFTWSDVPEGHKYWETIRNKYR